MSDANAATDENEDDFAQLSETIRDVAIGTTALIRALRPNRGPERARFERKLKLALRTAPEHPSMYRALIELAIYARPRGCLPRPGPRPLMTTSEDTT